VRELLEISDSPNEFASESTSTNLKFVSAIPFFLLTEREMPIIIRRQYSNTMKPFLPAAILLAFLLSAGSAKAQVEDLIFLTFDPAPSNPGDIAAHPDVANILPWVNASEVSNPFTTPPSPDFDNGYAGLDVNPAQFGFKWGFEGGFEILGSIPWEVQSISFDYDVLGHNGEASLALNVGPWSGVTPLPSTQSLNSGPAFPFDPNGPTIGVQTTGTVTFDFAANLLTVSWSGSMTDYTETLTDSIFLGPGVHQINLLTSNTAPASSGFFDANVSAIGSAEEAFYRIDNFRITALPIPEPRSAMLLAFAGAVLAGRRKR